MKRIILVLSVLVSLVCAKDTDISTTQKKIIKILKRSEKSHLVGSLYTFNNSILKIDHSKVKWYNECSIPNYINISELDMSKIIVSVDRYQPDVLIFKCDSNLECIRHKSTAYALCKVTGMNNITSNYTTIGVTSSSEALRLEKLLYTLRELYDEQ